MVTVGHETEIWTKRQPWRWEEVGTCLKVELIKLTDGLVVGCEKKEA